MRLFFYTGGLDRRRDLLQGMTDEKNVVSLVGLQQRFGGLVADALLPPMMRTTFGDTVVITCFQSA